MRAFHRRHHQLIAELLAALDGNFLRNARCYFGGGTQIALALGEYRESRDIDFLCADRDGYRLLRETITQQSLGKIARKQINLAREIRADRDGIRTFCTVRKIIVKFEIVLESRIELRGKMDRALGVPVLGRKYAIAEKLLANSDRGWDPSTHQRDLVDLAFLAAHTRSNTMRAGLQLARASYGAAINRHLAATLAELVKSKDKLHDTVRALGVTDLATLERGLENLRSIASDH